VAVRLPAWLKAWQHRITVATAQKLDGAQNSCDALLVARPASPQSPLSRRDRRKQETTDHIKATAPPLVGRGPAAISLRAIARGLGMTASAVHYYSPSRQALLEDLIVDGFSSPAGALRSSYDQAGPVPPGERWLTACAALTVSGPFHRGRKRRTGRRR
jgi:AcrR family transcriptional regulator